MLNSRVYVDFMIEKQRAGPLSVPIISYDEICKIEWKMNILKW